MSKYTLEFKEKSIQALAGFQYGREIYKNQVSNTIDFSESEIVFVFPEHITFVASSFIEGFFSEIRDALGPTGVSEKIKIESINLIVKQKIEMEL